MKSYEKRLLNHLQVDNSQRPDDPLSNVRKAMGEIAYVPGNPLTKTEITLQITSKYFALGANTQIIPNNLPVILKNNLGFNLFGLTDFYGGYIKSRQVLNNIPTVSNVAQNPNKWVFLESTTFPGGLNQKSLGIFGYNLTDNGLSIFYQIALTQINYVQGDLIIIYEAYIPGVETYLAIFVIHCNNVAYGTFLNSFVSDLITINTMRVIVPIGNIEQFINPFIFGYQTLFGKTFTDSIDPRMYITSTDFQQQICDIPINLPVDKAVMLGCQMNYDCQNMQIILFVEKIEPLTHKYNLSKKYS